MRQKYRHSQTGLPTDTLTNQCTDIQTGPTDRHRQTFRWTDLQTYRVMDILSDRQTDRLPFPADVPLLVQHSFGGFVKPPS